MDMDIVIHLIHLVGGSNRQPSAPNLTRLSINIRDCAENRGAEEDKYCEQVFRMTSAKGVNCCEIETSVLKCSVCIDYFIAPMSLECGHTFCENCIAASLTHAGPRCPLCGRRATRLPAPSLLLNRFIAFELGKRLDAREMVEWEERGAAFARAKRELRRHESRRRRMQRRFAHAVYKRELADQTEEHSHADEE